MEARFAGGPLDGQWLEVGEDPARVIRAAVPPPVEWSEFPPDPVRVMLPEVVHYHLVKYRGGGMIYTCRPQDLDVIWGGPHLDVLAPGGRPSAVVQDVVQDQARGEPGQASYMQAERLSDAEAGQRWAEHQRARLGGEAWGLAAEHIEALLADTAEILAEVHARCQPVRRVKERGVWRNEQHP